MHDVFFICDKHHFIRFESRREVEAVKMFRKLKTEHPDWFIMKTKE